MGKIYVGNDLIMVLQSLLIAFFQITIFSIFPFIFYLFLREKKGFLRYIGLIKPTFKSTYYSIILTILYLIFWFTISLNNSSVLGLVQNPATIVGNIKQIGFSFEAIIMLLIVSVFQTSFSEEIFFRGFLGKRLINIFNFRIGNTLQAIVFSLIHVLLIQIILTEQNYGLLIFIFLVVGIIGYLLGYLKEKIGNGSIIPGWISHALSNTIAFYVFAFVL